MREGAEEGQEGDRGDGKKMRGKRDALATNFCGGAEQWGKLPRLFTRTTGAAVPPSAGLCIPGLGLSAVSRLCRESCYTYDDLLSDFCTTQHISHP